MNVEIKNYVRMEINEQEQYKMTLLEFNSLLVFVNNHKTVLDFEVVFHKTQLQNFFKNFVFEFFLTECIISQLLNGVKQEKILILY